MLFIVVITSVILILLIINVFVIKEYEEGTSPEAIIVHDLDKFDMIFQAYEYETGNSMSVYFY